ncbi:ATP-binding protein [Candidatus Micrarchaeota archaeon]|nr:ATP-binding protein [Candidatus Micrarchaeota archaeon]
MKFYDRDGELEALKRACSGKGAEMVVISGRRRVGKSRLVEEFLKGRPHARVLVVPKEEKQVAEDFAKALADEYAPSFGTVREALEYFFTKSGKRILHVDEFPNLAEVNPALPYEFQSAWEKHKDGSSKVLIFSGSYVSMMDRIFTRQKAPLFNRAGYYLLLQPLPIKIVWKIQEDIGVKSVSGKVENYCVFGGIPFYYELIEKGGASNVIDRLFFDVAATLKEEGQNLLRQEFGAAYKKYFSIIEAIGAGLVSASEIAGKLGVSQTTLSKYLLSLQRDFRLIERTVPFGQNPSRSKKGVYSIKENVIAFWFACVNGKTRPPYETEFNEFVGRRFEPFCREFLAEHLTRRGEQVVKTGRWWGSAETKPKVFEQREIDVVVETQDALYVGECKWTKEKAGGKELERLKESAKGLKTKKPLKFVLFSKNGFNTSENAECLFFDLKTIGSEIGKFH